MTEHALHTESGAPLSPLGLGCSRFGSLGNPADAATLRATVDRALACGVNVFDTADIYGQGDSERILGRALRNRAEHAFVITKVGKRFSLKMRLMRPLKGILRPLIQRYGRKVVVARRAGEVGEDFTAERLPEALDASLRRLGMKRVDGLFLHSPPAHVAGDPAVAQVLARLKAQGKVRHYGVSCDDLASLEAALAMPGLELLQLPVDLIADLGAERMVAIAGRGITVLAREAIVLRPDLSPPDAVRAATALTGVTCVLAGASSPSRIAELALASGCEAPARED